MKEMDMAPYEEYFTKLEKLFFEKNARMNIVAYMFNKNSFTEDQYDKVFNDYLNSLKEYELFISVFESEVIIPVNGKDVNWTADFIKRVIYIE